MKLDVILTLILSLSFYYVIMCRTCTTVYLLLVGYKITKKLLLKSKTKCKDFIFGVMSRLVSELDPHCGQMLDPGGPDPIWILKTSVADPDPPDPHVFGLPGSGSATLLKTTPRRKLIKCYMRRV
jgi:hypothetical protein